MRSSLCPAPDLAPCCSAQPCSAPCPKPCCGMPTPAFRNCSKRLHDRNCQVSAQQVRKEPCAPTCAAAPDVALPSREPFQDARLDEDARDAGSAPDV